MSEGQELTIDCTIELSTEDTDADSQTNPVSNLSSLRRHLLMASQKAVKNPRMESTSSNSQQNELKKYYANSGKLPIKVTHRLCQICHVIKPISDIVMLSDEVEKLFILLFAIYRRKLIVDATIRLYRQPALYTCYSHFGETSSEILKMFGVTSAVGIFRARQRKVTQIVKFVNHMSGRLTEEARLLNFAYLFMMQYPATTPVVGPLMRAEDIPFESTIECKTAGVTEAIVPKCFRQPRKQRLENEEEGCSSSMLRVIKREPLHLPSSDPSFQPLIDPSSRELIRTPVQCCYCLQIREKDNLIYIAKTKFRLDAWRQYLGNSFGSRLRSNLINYMCRRHFSPSAFSLRGRLRRAAIPNTVPPPQVHTFKIEGDEFVKVSEEDLKDGFDEEIEIDVEN